MARPRNEPARGWMRKMRLTEREGQRPQGRLEARKEARYMSTLMRAKAALVLAALLLTTGVGPAALAATVEGGAQPSVGIVALRHAADGVQTRIILEGTA